MKMSNFNFEKLVYNTYYIPFNVNLNPEGSFYRATNNCIYFILLFWGITVVKKREGVWFLY